MKSFWASYRSLPPKTRVYLGLGGITLALTGHFVSDWLENKIPVDSQQTSDSASSSQTINTSQ
ncbi:7231_t:CDS:2 [Funneliformis caledonium]|uniref:7231_t:CDS:1 n=1 Tax=Funneliformis caledonium TaxID=1117310 RepID=A0A9N9DX78_9GLOM|nr:7231_t:CDS:2 [Funneliformis caledonium]